jgi:F420-dependent oxidoreductase-like protein
VWKPSWDDGSHTENGLVRGLGPVAYVAAMANGTVFGVHAGLQDTTSDELRDLWRRIEELGFGWISVWDHFYSASMDGSARCLEAVSTHTALACATDRVRCGSLVYAVGYRHPAVLAKAIATIDQFSGGRADVGIGAGWHFIECAAYGIPFPSTKERMDMLEEGVQVLRSLLHEEVSNFDGRDYTLTDARLEPRPVQEKVPIWIGGGGEKRTLRICAKYADGWNIPFTAPEVVAHKRDVLHQHCADVGRDPADIRVSVNVGLAWSEDALKAQFGPTAEGVRPGVLMGSPEEVHDMIGRYEEAGVGQINIALRAPFDVPGLERLAEVLSLA